MGAYGTLKYYVRIDFHKNAYYGHTDLFSALKVRLRKTCEFSVSRFEVIGAVPFHLDPGFEQPWPRAAQSIFQIKKAHPGSGRTSTPLLVLQTSAVKLVTLDRDRSPL